MIVLVLLMFTTGTILWLANQGFSLNATLWRFVFTIHPVGGWVFFLLIIGHLALNKKLFQSDIKILWKKSQ
ncbi:MAG: hypothetical protein ABDK94_06490 [Atribacterota bacterium]